MSVPIEVPSLKNSTWLTPLSSLAFAATPIVPWTEVPSAGALIDTEGGWSTATLLTVTEIGAEVVVWFAVSVASAVRVCDPFAAAVLSHWTDQPPLLLVSVPIGVAPSKNRTWETPLSSVAFALTATVPLTVSPSEGELIDTDGGLSTVAPGIVTSQSLPSFSEGT